MTERTLEDAVRSSAFWKAEVIAANELIARVYMRLQCADVPREPWHREVSRMLSPSSREATPPEPAE